MIRSTFKSQISNSLPAAALLLSLLVMPQAAEAQTRAGKTPWWKHAVFYEIYPRSFKDSDGDGVGGLSGA